MGLAVTNSFREFYSTSKVREASTIFERVVNAPWMSSGLTANNAFTTTLVLRTFGFLEEEKLLGSQPAIAGATQQDQTKTWELHLGIKNPFHFAEILIKHADAASEFFWLSLSDKTRDDLPKSLSAAGGAP
jgi:hypothetical protein